MTGHSKWILYDFVRIELRAKHLEGRCEMDKLIEDLLSIERAAKESLAGLEKERAAQALLTEEEIIRRKQEIKRKAAAQVEALKHDAKTTGQAKLAEIESEYRHEAEQLQALFDSNAATWRKEWGSRILHYQN